MREYTVTFPAALVVLSGFPQTYTVRAESEADAELRATEEVIAEHARWTIPLRRSRVG